MLRLASKLKSLPVLFQLNARRKSRATIRNYLSVCQYYADRERSLTLGEQDEYTKSLLRNRLSSRPLRTKRVAGQSLRILFVGTDLLQDTSGFVQTLEQFGEVDTFTKSEGEYGHYFYGQGRAAERLREDNGRRLIELITAVEEEGGVDLVLGQMWGRTMPWGILKAVQEMGIVTINVCMDDRHSFRGKNYKGDWMGSLGLVKGLDLVLTTAPEACFWYAVEGCPAVFWPEASDPNVFQPMDVPQKHDVCFVGANYGVRAKVVRAIEKRGVTVACYGNGWPNGRIATEDVPQLFAESKIVLGGGVIGYCEDFYSLKLRDFDGPMSGSLYLTHDNPDLRKLYDVGKEIVTYRTPEECAEKVVYYLEHPDETEAIARAGLDRALKDHTLKTRFEQLFRILGLETR